MLKLSLFHSSVVQPSGVFFVEFCTVFKIAYNFFNLLFVLVGKIKMQKVAVNLPLSVCHIKRQRIKYFNARIRRTFYLELKTFSVRQSACAVLTADMIFNRAVSRQHKRKCSVGDYAFVLCVDGIDLLKRCLKGNNGRVEQPCRLAVKYIQPEISIRFKAVFFSQSVCSEV